MPCSNIPQVYTEIFESKLREICEVKRAYSDQAQPYPSQQPRQFEENNRGHVSINTSTDDIATCTEVTVFQQSHFDYEEEENPCKLRSEVMFYSSSSPDHEVGFPLTNQNVRLIKIYLHFSSFISFT